jgi:hypothetical protein
MSDVMTQIGNFLNSSQGKGLMGAGIGGAGLIQNIMANNEAQKKQKFVEQLISNPAKFSAYVKGFQQPLQAGLTSDISRQTDAYGAERGLGSSPAVMKDVYAQALAPVLQQQQQSAEQAALQSLGIYENSPTTKPGDVSSILKVLMMQPPASNTTPGYGQWDFPSPSAQNLPQPGISTNTGDFGPLPQPTIGGGDGTANG